MSQIAAEAVLPADERVSHCSGRREIGFGGIDSGTVLEAFPSRMRLARWFGLLDQPQQDAVTY